MKKDKPIRIRMKYVDIAEDRAQKYRTEAGENVTQADIINTILMKSTDVENEDITKYLRTKKS